MSQHDNQDRIPCKISMVHSALDLLIAISGRPFWGLLKCAVGEVIEESVKRSSRETTQKM